MIKHFVLISALIFFSLSPSKADVQNLKSVNSRVQFVRTDGKYLIDGNGRILQLMGISFINNAWDDFSKPQDNYNNLPDYQKVAGLGFNSVRMYLNYRWFEEGYNPVRYKESGFRWLDQSIQWAGSNNILLVLSLCNPHGGIQLNGKVTELWLNAEIRNRFIAFWKEVALRYANEPVILGYDILNSPDPPENIGQWEDLANETVRAIRRVDTNHVIIVQRADIVNHENMKDNINGDMNFVKINDSNVMYGFIFNKPVTFSQQGSPWTPALYGVISRYPDENISEIAGNFDWKITVSSNIKPPVGFSDWYYFESQPFTVNDPQIKFGIPIALASRLGFFDSALFDDIVIEEFDPNGKKLRSWFADMESNDYWYLYDGKDFVQGVIDPFGGRNGTHALKISGPAENIGLNGVFHLFPAVQGNSYKISGWIKTVNFSKSSQIGLRIDFYSSDGGVLKRNKAYIQKEFDRLTAWRDKVNAPVYLCDFACIRYAFDFERGGLKWVSDVMDACLERGIGYNYRGYYDVNFGLYQPENIGVRLNRPLYDFFIKKQTGEKK